MKTLPPTIAGLEYVSLPSLAAHFTFWVVRKSIPDPSERFLPGTNDAGMPRSTEDIFLVSVPPHCGQGLALATVARPNNAIPRKENAMHRTKAGFVLMNPRGQLYWRLIHINYEMIFAFSAPDISATLRHV